MIKKIFLFLVILVVAAVVAIYFLGSSALNKSIKTGVEKFGPQVTQTSVRLDEVNLSILSGNGTITGLYVGNPDGYKSQNIFALGQVVVDIDTSSVFNDKIVINKIIIHKPEISYEKTLMSSNIKELMQNIEAFTGSADETAAESEQAVTAGDSSAKQVVIKQLVIEDGTVYVGLMGAGMTVPLPRIEMNDIGEDGNKNSMPEIIDLILTEVLESIGPAIADTGDIVGEGGKDVLEQGEAALEKATNSFKGLFGK